MLPHWLISLLACLTGFPKLPTPVKPVSAPNALLAKRKALPGTHKRLNGSTGLLDVVPILWTYVSGRDRLALRLCCREGRQIHDSLVTSLCICDETSVLNAVPPNRLPREIPTCREAPEVTSRALRGLTSRGCQPHRLLISLSGGNERCRHEHGLAVLATLSEASHELDTLHLSGMPFTPQSTRALRSLLLSVAPGPSGTTSPSAADLLSLRLNLYGYNLARQPAAVSMEMVAAALAPRLARLELWGCVGWPKRLGAVLQTCSRLRHLTLSFEPLVTRDALNPAAAAAAAGRLPPHSPHPSHHPSPIATAAASGAVALYGPVAAATTAYCVVKALGCLRQLRCLELRGCSLHHSRPCGGSSSATTRRPVNKRPPRQGSKAAEREAQDAASPSTQQLACALYQLTGLTRLALDGLATVTPLLTELAVMKGLRSLELPDVSAGPQDMEAITRAAPQLVSLTLGSVGQGAVLELCDARERANVASTRPPEALVLPTTLAALNVVRDRPTLRTMRALRLALEGRAMRGPASGRAEVLVVVPGIELDLLDVEFDPLMAFHRSEDGVMRSMLLSESKEALVAAIRLLAPPPPPSKPSAALRPCRTADALGASAELSAGRDNGGGNGGGCGLQPGAGLGDVEFEEESIVLQQRWQRDLVIHNVQGSLEPPAAAAAAEQPPQPQQHPGEFDSVGVSALPDGAGVEAGPASGAGEEVVKAADVAAWAPAEDRPTGHAVWILEMKPLELRSLELYGVGMQPDDLAAVAELHSLQRLTLASAELAVDALPLLASLTSLEHLEIARCTSYRRAGRLSIASSSRGSVNGYGGHDADGEGSSRTAVRSRHALLELCVKAPALRVVLVVRSAGAACMGNPDGPLGAEWVRRQLKAMGPRQAGQALGQGLGPGRVGANVATDWPEVSWT